MITTPGADTYAVSAKPLGPLANSWEIYLGRAHQDHLSPKIAVVGAGVAGVELALSMAHRLNKEGFSNARVSLFEARPEILSEVASSVRHKLLQELGQYDVDLIVDAHVSNITETEISFKSETPSVSANFIVTAAGALPHPWLGETRLSLHNGYIEVDNTLRSVNTPHVFAAGDCAHLSFGHTYCERF